MSTHPLAHYLADCRNRRSTGATTPETSLYSPLEALLNAAAAKLKPKVLCFMNLKDQGAGMPDGGLFTKDQIAKNADAPPAGQKPARGAIECKPPKGDVLKIADTQQVTDYWESYNQVLVTNYREFLLIGRDEQGKQKHLEHYRLAESEKEFWLLTQSPDKTAEIHGLLGTNRRLPSREGVGEEDRGPLLLFLLEPGSVVLEKEAELEVGDDERGGENFEPKVEEFDQIWIDNLNGDKYKTGKTTPDGQPDPSVFSTPQNREGIQVGTAVALLSRVPKHEAPAEIRFRDFWGVSKREELLESVQPFDASAYTAIAPKNELALSLRPEVTAQNYTDWPQIPDLYPTTFPGVQTGRDDLLVDISLPDLKARIRSYFDPQVSDEEMAALCTRAMSDSQRFDAKAVRKTLQRRGVLEENFFAFVYRPFDVRWIYWEPTTKLLDEKREEYVRNLSPENLWIAAVQQNRKSFDAPTASSMMACRHVVERGANLFPMVTKDSGDTTMFGESANDRKLGNQFANVSDEALRFLKTLNGVTDAPQLFHHVIAIMHAPTYATENASALRQDWPRIPLPKTREALVASADLGRQVAALLDPETAVPGVTAGKIRPELKLLGVAAKVGGGQLAGSDFAVTARWGIAGKGGITMPSTGDSRPRQFTGPERTALAENGIALLGPDTLDIHLNDAAYWQNVPRQVWEYTLGGYQVLKKWLSYREETLLGRPLTPDEISYITQTIRRIASLLLLGTQLDANYAGVKADTYAWPK